MAIEDTYVLSNLLGSCKSKEEIEKAFEAYDSARVPRALKVTAMSLKQGELLDMQGENLEMIWKR
jgi:salicylate hydroxylase